MRLDGQACGYVANVAVAGVGSDERSWVPVPFEFLQSGECKVESKKLVATIDTPVEVRDELHDLISRDLLGPANGPNEEVLENRVLDHYLVGMLAPAGGDISELATAADDDPLSGAGETSNEEGAPEPVARASTSFFRSSVGITVSVDSAVANIQIETEWGRYQKATSEIYSDEEGQSDRVWKRSPCGGVADLDLSAPGQFTFTCDPQHPGVVLEVHIRPERDAQIIVTAFLVNKQPESSPKDEAWIFQPRIRVFSNEVEAPLVARLRSTPSDGDSSDWREISLLAMLHRRHGEFAIGHGIGVAATPAADPWMDESGWGRATEVSTAVLPTWDVPQTDTPSNEELSQELSGFEPFVLDMETLSSADQADLVELLNRIPNAYESWIDNQEARVFDDESLAEYEETVRDVIRKCRRAVERIREGIGLVGNVEDDKAYRAFVFANRAMALQRVHSEYALLVRRDSTAEYSEVDTPKNRSWRPFQLAFLLLNLPGATLLEHEDRTSGFESTADLLWFPTGGGKTEAYLGVASYTMAMRRLRGVIEGRTGDGGVSVIMRYTLRLLTLQQFQRASALMCAQEVLREEDPATWGTERFTIGLWVGNNSTPGRTVDSAEWIKSKKGDARWSSAGGSASPLQLTNCPWCGSPLSPNELTATTYRKGARTTLHCGDPSHRCRFTKKHSKGGIPVVVVDEEIYRTLPTLLLATVDKFARMPWEGRTQALFGAIAGHCPDHGYCSPDADCFTEHPSKVDRKAVPLQPPDMILQDELHLISGPLGTMVGLYETVVDELSTWTVAGKTVRPKVIASTATTRRAEQQVSELFCRQVAIFPPTGLDISDNFFARQRKPSADKPGRRYVGICAPGRSRVAALIRLYVATLTSAQGIREELPTAQLDDVDPYLTLVGYFNSLRELGGMRRLVDDDVQTRARRIEREDRPGLSNRFVRIVEELTSRVSSSDIPVRLDQLEVPFKAPGENFEKGETRPVDVVLATNMLSVGVDVGRLGVMVVAGQPKSTAEYIQATSRVGRRHPGLVLSLLNWSRPRDLSHYESFEHYHATFYQQVEALSVTPFSSRALDRGLAGALAAWTRLSSLEGNPNGAAAEVATIIDHDEATKIFELRAENISDDSEVGERVHQFTKQKLEEWSDEADRGERHLGYRESRDGTTVGLLRQPGTGRWQSFTVPNSMREVEPNVGLILRPERHEDLEPWDFSELETLPE